MSRSYFTLADAYRQTSWFRLAVVGLLVTASAMAQEVSAGITGRVTDPSGASIVGAKVNAKDLDRGVDWPTVSNQDGIYAFPQNSSGALRTEGGSARLQDVHQSQCAGKSTKERRVDVSMQVGAISEERFRHRRSAGSPDGYYPGRVGDGGDRH